MKHASRNGPGEIKMSEFRSSTKTGDSFVAGTTFGLKPVTYAEIEGRAIFEGDIDLGSVEQMEQVRAQVDNAANQQVAFGVSITAASSVGRMRRYLSGSPPASPIRSALPMPSPTCRRTVTFTL